MNNYNEDKNFEWKKELRTDLIKALTGTSLEKFKAFEQIGYYYTCCAPTYLYKYYCDSAQNLESVINNKLWYSAPCNFNDVFDSDIIVDKKEILDTALRMSPDKREIRVGSPMWKNLQQIINKKIGSLQSTFDDLKAKTGISCFSEADNSLLMWAHYANNHCGMCIEYELIEINKKLGFSPVPIVYSNEKVHFRLINLNTIEAESLIVFLESLTTKSPEWSYENEWRIIRDDGACGDRWDRKNHGALLDMICPHSIILGCMAKPEFEMSVRKYCENNRINLYKMEKNKYLYCLEKIPILQFDD